MSAKRTIWTIFTVGVLAGAVSGGAVTFQIVAAGDCPGELSLTAVGASPEGTVGIFRGSLEGSGTIPDGPCAGSDSGLEDPQLVFATATDGEGVFAVILQLKDGACGTLLQTVDDTTCAVSNVERLASGFPGPVPVTGRKTRLVEGDDGDLERGLAAPEPRFADNADGTVTDLLTGLVWLRDADCFGTIPWPEAIASSSGLESGECGLIDGSRPGDWRLPNLRELQSLIDYEQEGPALPTGHLFHNVVSSGYWSSTSSATGSLEIWGVRLGTGEAGLSDDPTGNYVLPVRDR